MDHLLQRLNGVDAPAGYLLLTAAET